MRLENLAETSYRVFLRLLIDEEVLQPDPVAKVRGSLFLDAALFGHLLHRLDFEIFGNAGRSCPLLMGLIIRLGGVYEIGQVIQLDIAVQVYLRQALVRG